MVWISVLESLLNARVIYSIKIKDNSLVKTGHLGSLLAAFEEWMLAHSPINQAKSCNRFLVYVDTRIIDALNE